MNKTKIRDKVMSKIKKGEVKMRPKVFFVIGSILLGTGLALALLLAAFFANVMIFRLRILGFLPPLMLLRFLLQWPTLLAILAIVVGIKLLQEYEVGHKFNLWGVLVAVVAFALTLGFLLSRTGLNEQLRGRPFTRHFYNERMQGEPVKGWPAPPPKNGRFYR